MKSWFDRYLHKFNVEFSKDELSKMEKLKADYSKCLFEDFSIYYEMFDCETSTHIISTSKINALESIKQGVENGKIFDKSYFDIIQLKGATVLFNDYKFMEFAISYSILDHDCEQSAFIVLKEIWQVHLLNLMILEWHKNDIQLSTNYFKITLDYDTIIFPNKISHQFFIETINRPEFEIKRKWLSQLFRFLKGKNNGKNECFLKGNEFEFADYWNRHKMNYEIKKHQKGIGLNGGNVNSMEYELIESWYKEFAQV